MEMIVATAATTVVVMAVADVEEAASGSITAFDVHITPNNKEIAAKPVLGAM